MATPLTNTSIGDIRGLASFLFDHPADPDGGIAFWFDGMVTLAQMQREAVGVAEALSESAVAQRQPVVHVVDSGAAALGVMFGVWLAGGVYVPVNGRLTDAEIAAQLAATKPAAIATSRSRRIEGAVPLMVDGRIQYWAPLQGIPRSPDDTALPDGTALVMRTSGTTGTAKPIVLSHQDVAHGIDTVLSSLRTARPDDGRSQRPPMPNLIPTSLALWAGIWNVLFALRAGSPVVLMDRFDTMQFATLVRKHDIRSTVLAPAMMSMLTEDPRITDLAPLTMVRSVTAPLTPHQARAFNAKFAIGIMNGYGQTELGGEVFGWTAKDLREHGHDKLGSVGRQHAGIDVRILEDGADLPRGEVGEIWIRSPYATKDAGVSAQLIDGFLCTGDIGYLDGEGFLWLEGRASDVINRGGLKVLPQEIEEQLCARPEVVEACVAGVPDVRLGEVPMAWIRAASGITVDPDALLTGLRDTLAGYKVPVGIEVLAELPRNEIGKVLRPRLVEQWVARNEEPKGN